MKNSIKKVMIALFVLFGWMNVQAQIVEKPNFGKIAITGATVHTVSNGVIENGVVLINGKNIEYVGNNAKISDDYMVIDATGKHVYPGFMDAGTSLGLVEISAVPVTVDNREVGQFNPHMRAFTAFNPHSAAVPVTRVSGVTHVISAPSGGIISGKAALMDLWGYSPDSMAVLENAGLMLNLPSSGSRGWWDNRSEKEIKEAYEKDIKQIDDYLSKSLFYNEMMNAFEANSRGKAHPDKDLALEAMREVVTGRIPVGIEVNREKDILAAIEWTKKYPNMRFIFIGVNEGWRVAEEIAAAEIPVLVSTLYTPTRDYDHTHRPYENPGLLAKAGVKVAIATGETENVRNAPFNAGYAATYGMGKEEALKAITLYPAQIFGVDDRLGSLEAGKQANLFIADGDPFEPLTQIEQVFIKGFMIPMESRHTQLYQEFLDRDAVKN